MHSIRGRLLGLLALAGLLLSVAAVWAAVHDDASDFPYLDLDDPAIHYSSPTSNDPVARLQQQMDKGQVKLDYDADHLGYLPSVLKQLDLNTDSQLLVFSKTSFQAPKISPQNPRALYFNDQGAVGYVHGGDVIEVISLDPQQGLIFYTLDLQKTDKPQFVRRTTECLQCHLIPGTLDVPGLEATSVIPSSDGTPRFPASALIVDGRTPLEKRWGGWYVTGMSGGLMHRGNSVAPRPDEPDVLDLNGNQNVMSLAKRFDVDTYLAPGSDIVALLTLEHQTRVVNLMIRLGWETRIAMQQGKLEASRERLNFVADQLVAYMLFVNEAKIYEPISGESTFTKTFAARGPRDQKDRSLRDFDLNKRLFRYPLSYMIYSQVFDGMPEFDKQMVYQKLYDVLTGKNDSSEFARLSADDRRAVLEIVRDTKTGLPAYWK